MSSINLEKLINEGLIIEITDKSIILSTNEINRIEIQSLDLLTDELLLKLLTK